MLLLVRPMRYEYVICIDVICTSKYILTFHWLATTIVQHCLLYSQMPFWLATSSLTFCSWLHCPDFSGCLSLHNYAVNANAAYRRLIITRGHSFSRPTEFSAELQDLVSFSAKIVQFLDILFKTNVS